MLAEAAAAKHHYSRDNTKPTPPPKQTQNHEVTADAPHPNPGCPGAIRR